MHRLATWLTAAALALLPATAWPCGGFFCSGGVANPPPVVQTGEKIFFGHENGETTAVVQILYQGQPIDFAWVVPVPAVPQLSVGSDQLFTLLDQATMPTFGVQWQTFCRSPLALGCACGAGSPMTIDRTMDGGTGGVTVVSRGPVGPYDSAVLSATNPQALRDWLSANGFDFSQQAADLAASYVAKGDYFVALKLLSDRTVGDLQPIVLKYREATGPCVPIRLTAVAAQPDLGIAVFLLGDGRGVPTNYQHLVVNDARIDWVNQGANYTDVVTAAANEAGGQGFVTDFSGPSAAAGMQVGAAFQSISRGDYTRADPFEFVAEVVRNVGLGSQNVLGLLERCVPVPDAVKRRGVSAAAFYQSMTSFSADVTQPAVAQPQCANEVETLVAKPLRDAALLLNRLPTLTRLYTTLSPDEMTLDPLFAFNKDLPPVANARTVTGKMLCNGNQPVAADLTSGDQTFSVEWGKTIDTAPALLRAEQLSASGPPVVKLDNAAAVELANRRSLGCACAVTGGSSAVVLGLLLLLWSAQRRRPVRV